MFDHKDTSPSFDSDFSEKEPGVRCASGEPSNGDLSASPSTPPDSLEKQSSDAAAERLRRLGVDSPVSVYSRIAEVSLYFERTWSRERILTIENCLELVPDDIRAELFERLLEIDLSLGFERSVQIAPSEYKKRFPEWGDAIDRIYRQVTQQSVIIHKMRLGRRIGNYVIEQILGKGGMGIVYKALDAPFHRMVAIKYLLPDSSRQEISFELFQREIALMGQLPPGTAFAQAYSCDRDGDFHYLVMEYIDGVDLVRYIHEETPRRKAPGPLDWREATELIRQVAVGLETIHRLGIIHRDIKPENIMLDTEGRVRILDLGLGLLRENAASSWVPPSTGDKDAVRSTRSIPIMGTPAYMSPEGYRAPETIDSRSDLYSLGGTFFFLLTGELPVEWHSPQSNEPAEPLRDYFRRVGISIRPDVLAILSRLLEPDREKRYQKASEAVRDLNALLNRHSPIQQRERQRRRLRILFAGFLLAAFAAALSLYTFGFSDLRNYAAAKRLFAEGTPKKSLALMINTRPEKLPEKTRHEFLFFRGQLFREQAKDKEDLRNALSDFNSLLKECPEDIPCLEETARIYTNLNEYNGAKNAICRAIKISPRDDVLRRLDGEIMIRWGESGQKDFEESRALFNEAIDILSETHRSSPLTPESLYWRARAYYRAGHREFALHDLERAMSLKNPFPEARDLRGDICFSIATNETTDESTACRMALLAAEDFHYVAEYIGENHKKYTALLLKSIRAYDRAGEHTLCIQRCGELQAADPNSPFVPFYRGRSNFLMQVDTERSEANRAVWREISEDLAEALTKDVDQRISTEERAKILVMSAISSLAWGDDPNRTVSSITEALKINQGTALYRFNETTWNVYEIRRQAYAALGETEKARLDAKQSFEVMLQTSEYATMTSADLSEPATSGALSPNLDVTEEERPVNGLLE